MAAVVFAASTVATADAGEVRWFPDRPVAWFEHDDADVPAAPSPSHLQDLDQTLVVRDSLANEVDRVLSVEDDRPAQDVNAADEVPCSTWFCARNHLRPMTPDEIVTGPPGAPPTPPLRIVKGKDGGASLGFQVVDAAGRKFMLKFDPSAYPGLSSSGEIIGARIFYAAGYYALNAFLVSVAPKDLVLDPAATFKLYGVQRRPLLRSRVDAVLARAARNADGGFRAVAVPWMPGKVLGGFDMIGRRDDDPNDRIPHEDRRSLRADWVLYAWLSVFDASAINSLESYVEEDGKRFVRHYHFDFGCAFGSAAQHPQSPREDGERTLEVGRSLRALFSLGLYRRPFQTERSEWERLTQLYPAIGYYPAETFDPDAHRTNRKVPAHMRLTSRDAYWGAKVVTSFSDAQIDAVVGAAELSPDAASYLAHAMKVRRDIIGRRYLRPFAAVEEPVMSGSDGEVCFRDLAIERGYATVESSRYAFEVTDGHGNRLLAGGRPATGTRTCLPIGGAGRGTGYRVVQISMTGERAIGPSEDARATKASRIHLRWRESEKRFVVVGLERDE